MNIGTQVEICDNVADPYFGSAPAGATYIAIENCEESPGVNFIEAEFSCIEFQDSHDDLSCINKLRCTAQVNVCIIGFFFFGVFTSVVVLAYM